MALSDDRSRPTYRGADTVDEPAEIETGRDARLRAKEHAENFPVALRVLPRRYRAPLGAVYDVVRVIDDLGDEAPGDRTALLKDFAEDLSRVWRGGAPRAEVLRRLVPSVRACGLEQEPFDRLIAANLQDQRVVEYASYDELRRYCTLSADPVGRIVLTIFGATPAHPGRSTVHPLVPQPATVHPLVPQPATVHPLVPQPATVSGVTSDLTSDVTVELSDRVCTALQLIEHWQDVGEDRRRGRVYLPREDLDSFGVPPRDLDAPTASPALRRLMVFETDRAAALLDSGAPLVGLLRGWARLAVGGYVAGGRAALDALRRSGGDVLGAPVRARRSDMLRHLVRQLIRPARPASRTNPERGEGTAAC
jgi:phytoene/squalene synthetase